MRRVVIVGCGGAGKSTLARRLGAALALPVIHLDQHFWRPGWVETPREEWVERLRVLLRGDRWVADGNYGGTLDLRFEVADTIVFLDIPRRVCLYRVLRRVVRHYGRSRPDLAPGCPERFDWEFLRWIWSFPREQRPALEAKVAAYSAGRGVHVLRSSRGVRRFLATRAPRTPEHARET